MKNLFIGFILLCVSFLLPSSVSAATYYLSPTGNDALAGITEATAWNSFTRAFDSSKPATQRVAPGDTLILLDGIYKQTIEPKYGGTAGNPITIRAQNDGKAIIDGEFKRDPLRLLLPNNAHYYTIENIVFRNGNTLWNRDENRDGIFDTVMGNGVVIAIDTNYNILRRISAYNAATNENSSVIGFDGEHNLLEDCIAAGSGRKMINMSKSLNNTVRRCFVLSTEWEGRNRSNQWPWEDGIQVYNGSGNIVENSISYGSTPTWGISVQANSLESTAVNNKVLGSIAMYSGMNRDGTLKTWGCSYKYEPCNCKQFDGLQVSNIASSTLQEYNWCKNNGNVSESNGAVIFNFADRPQPVTDARYSTVTDFNWQAQRLGFNIHGAGNVSNNMFKDIFAYNNAGLGFSGGGSSNRLENATIVQNGRDAPNGDGGIGSEVDSLAGVTVTNSFIEGSSTHTGPGASLKYRYVDGVLTQQALWPWPMEDRIRIELADSQMIGAEYVLSNFSLTNTLVPLLNTYGVLDEPVIVPSATPTPSTSNKIGDTDGDGDVDIFDYNAVLGNMGTTSGATRSGGDLDGDGDVDIFDYNLIIGNFGR